MINFQQSYWITHWAHSFTFLYVKNITCRKMIEIRKDAEMTWAEDYVQTWGAAVERQSIWVVPGCGDNWEWRFLSLLFPFCHLQRQLMPLTKYGKILWEPLIQNGFYFWDYFGQSYWFDAFLNKFKMVTNLWLFNRQIFKLLSSNESFGHSFSHTEQSWQVMDCDITIYT